MLKIAVCDDEVLHRLDIVKKIKSVLYNYSKEDKFSIEEYSNGQAMVNENKYFDIVFLDIKMDKLSGIETAKKMRTYNEDTKIVFITAFKEYIFEALDVEPFHYLLKPVSIEKLNGIIKRIMDKLKASKDEKQFFLVSQGKNTIKVALDKVYFFEVQNRTINLHTEDEIIKYYDRISNVESLVSQKDFFRCHRSYIVNFRYIKKYDRNEIELDNGMKIMLSKNKYEEFTKSFTEYIKRSEL